MSRLKCQSDPVDPDSGHGSDRGSPTLTLSFHAAKPSRIPHCHIKNYICNISNFLQLISPLTTIWSSQILEGCIGHRCLGASLGKTDVGGGVLAHWTSR